MLRSAIQLLGWLDSSSKSFLRLTVDMGSLLLELNKFDVLFADTGCYVFDSGNFDLNLRK